MEPATAEFLRHIGIADDVQIVAENQFVLGGLDTAMDLAHRWLGAPPVSPA